MSTYARYDDPYEVIPVSQAEEPARVSYLRQVGLLTLGSLTITAIAAVVWMLAVFSVPILSHQYVALAVMLGGIYGAQFIGNSMLASASASTRTMGFVLGSSLSGIALSYVVGAAAILSAEATGNPLAIIGQAGGLVFLTVLGMVAYLLSGPKQMNWLSAGLSVMFLPMLGLMAITWFFPVGGIVGIAISGVFVLVSAGGLLFSLNQVIHQMSVDQAMAGAFHISTGIVVLFWNVLVLLMRLTSRD